MTLRAARVALALALVAALAACSAMVAGPLEGPRAPDGSVEVCLPAGRDRVVYFGEPFVNSSGATLSVTGVSPESHNASEVSFGWDTVGPVRGEILGGFSDPPAPGGSGAEDEILAALIEPDELILDGGKTAVLIFSIAPEDAAADATVSGIDIRYEAGGKRYVETVRVDYVLRPGDAC